MYNDVKSKSGDESLSNRFDLSTKPTMKVDVERYQKYLDDSDTRLCRLRLLRQRHDRRLVKRKV